jgi:Domain of unknown function (DUF4265)
VRTVGGELTGYPPAQEEDCTVWLALPDAPGEWEGVLGRRVSPGSAEVVGIPVFARGVNLGDVVRVVSSAEGADVVAAVVSRSGNRTFRAWFPPEGPLAAHRRLMDDLEPYGCWFDAWSERLVAVSASSEEAPAVAAELARREAAGELTYETGD